jgi:hypothetical protein
MSDAAQPAQADDRNNPTDGSLSDQEQAEAMHNLTGFVELLIEMDQQHKEWLAAKAAQSPQSKKARDFRLNNSEDNNQED